MNAQEMLDHVLGQADEATRERLLAEAAEDAVSADRLARLDQGLHLLLNDGPDDPTHAPPANLAARTMALIGEREHSRKRRTIHDFVPSRVPFRPTDVAVAAGVLIAGMLTLLPAVHRTRDRQNQAACVSNLRQLGQALWLYGARHDHFPFVPEVDRQGHAGVFAVVLREDGLLLDRRLLDCPCNGPCGPHPALPRLRELLALRARDPQRYREVLCFDYAYNVGFFRPSGRVGPIAVVSASTIPLLADKPGQDENQAILPGNSPNHAGRGQNVLFSDLHVGWHNSRRVSATDNDLFLNERRQPAPGLHANDFVLCPAMIPCGGQPDPGR